MLRTLAIISAGLLISRPRTHAGRSASWNINLQTPGSINDGRAKERCAEAVANALGLIDIEYLKEHPATPALYDAGVYYCDPGMTRVDRWNDIPTVLEKGCGNCTALTGWRLAELWRAGVTNAEAHAIYQPLDNGDELYHLLIRFSGTNQFEDPSKRLGMP
jgi:hypothetical protein